MDFTAKLCLGVKSERKIEKWDTKKLMSSSTIHLWVQLHVERQREIQAEVTLQLQFKRPSEWSLNLPLQIPHWHQPDFTITLISLEPDSLNHSFAVSRTVHMSKHTNSFRKYLSPWTAAHKSQLYQRPKPTFTQSSTLACRHFHLGPEMLKMLSHSSRLCLTTQEKVYSFQLKTLQMELASFIPKLAAQAFPWCAP